MRVDVVARIVNSCYILPCPCMEEVKGSNPFRSTKPSTACAFIGLPLTIWQPRFLQTALSSLLCSEVPGTCPVKITHDVVPCRLLFTLRDFRAMSNVLLCCCFGGTGPGIYCGPLENPCTALSAANRSRTRHDSASPVEHLSRTLFLNLTHSRFRLH